MQRCTTPALVCGELLATLSPPPLSHSAWLARAQLTALVVAGNSLSREAGDPTNTAHSGLRHPHTPSQRKSATLCTAPRWHSSCAKSSSFSPSLTLSSSSPASVLFQLKEVELSNEVFLRLSDAEQQRRVQVTVDAILQLSLATLTLIARCHSPGDPPSSSSLCIRQLLPLLRVRLESSPFFLALLGPLPPSPPATPQSSFPFPHSSTPLVCVVCQPPSALASPPPPLKPPHLPMAPHPPTPLPARLWTWSAMALAHSVDPDPLFFNCRPSSPCGPIST